jgi:F-type H+-transporting ATPase subunit b
LIVLGVIGKFVVPPIQKVLGERERMVAKTTEDNRRSADQEAAAEADYKAELAAARAEAAGSRDQARSAGRALLDEMRGRANEQVAGTLQQANDELKLQSDSIAPQLQSSVENLSVTLANRVLGVPVDSAAGTASGR